ncbi:MAG: hypothetical protein K2X11_18690, partial [Acetobacteraceae bacterium]|nr:hypothetical protein [Acetobacteraceae bacterium]
MNTALASPGVASAAHHAAEALAALRPGEEIRGRVTAVDALSVEVAGLSGFAALGTRVLLGSGAAAVPAEIVAVSPGGARAVAFGPLDGIRLGAPARLAGAARLAPCDGWL